jgi:hypothetical protein
MLSIGGRVALVVRRVKVENVVDDELEILSLWF